MAAPKEITFLCGKVMPYSDDLVGVGIVKLRNGSRIEVPQNDPGLEKVRAGMPRMIVVKNNRIWAVYARPRIRLLRMLERGADVTEEILEMYRPMYMKNPYL
ncbi:MAG: hypothetical protein WC444_02485 [Candidatus Paceibacterota bacterium]